MDDVRIVVNMPCYWVGASPRLATVVRVAGVCVLVMFETVRVALVLRRIATILFRGFVDQGVIVVLQRVRRDIVGIAHTLVLSMHVLMGLEAAPSHDVVAICLVARVELRCHTTWERAVVVWIATVARLLLIEPHR